MPFSLRTRIEGRLLSVMPFFREFFCIKKAVSLGLVSRFRLFPTGHFLAYKKPTVATLLVLAFLA
jgi:hypothetical protein